MRGLLFRVVLLLAAGCSDSRYKEVTVPKTMTLYALDYRSVNPAGLTNEEYFHGYRILGKDEVSDYDLRARIFIEVNGSLDSEKAEPSDCFTPRHALRYEQDGKTYDLVLSFECGQYALYVGDGAAKNGALQDRFQILLNRRLIKAEIQLAP